MPQFSKNNNLQKAQAIIFVFALVAPFILKNVVLVSFYVHQDYIAKTLCVEKDIENSCCKGNCVLQKELQKTDSGTDDLPQHLKDKTEIIFVLSEKQDDFFGFSENKIAHVSFYKLFRSEQHIIILVHPPAFA